MDTVCDEDLNATGVRVLGAGEHGTDHGANGIHGQGTSGTSYNASDSAQAYPETLGLEYGKDTILHVMILLCDDDVNDNADERAHATAKVLMVSSNGVG